MPAGHDSGPTRGTGRLGVHPREKYPLLAELVDVRCFPAAHLLNLRNAHFSYPGVVPHEVDYIGRGAMFLAQRLQFLV